MESFQRLESLIPFHREDLSPLTLSEPAILSALKRFNPKKVGGPVGVPNWLLKEYEDILVGPVTAVLNSYCSFAAQRRPSSLKMAHVTDINKHLRPISTRRSPCRPCGSGGDWSKSVYMVAFQRPPAYVDVHATYLVASQPRVGTAVRVELFDYRKALVFFSFIPSNFGLP